MNRYSRYKQAPDAPDGSERENHAGGRRVCFDGLADNPTVESTTQESYIARLPVRPIPIPESVRRPAGSSRGLRNNVGGQSISGSRQPLPSPWHADYEKRVRTVVVRTRLG